MKRSLPATLSLFALLALPGCASEVLAPDPDLPSSGFFGVFQFPPEQASASAVFQKGGALARSVEVDRVGACWLERHALLVSVPQQRGIDAGELRLTGALNDLTLDFASGYVVRQKSALFKPGEVLTLDVEGSDDIDPMTVTLPAPPTPVIAPPPATVGVSEDLTFKWTSPPGTGTVQIFVEVFWDGVKSDDGSETFFPQDILRCEADIAQGTLTMPASLLSQLSTSGPLPASFNAQARNVERRQTGDSAVSFLAQTGAVTPNGKAYHFEVELK